ncbi:MAG: hypothetical protein ACE5GB_01415 [Acidimicrobiales bacterium]
MCRALPVILVLAVVAAACSSGDPGELVDPGEVTSTILAQDPPTTTTSTAAPSRPGTPISAVDGGVVTFGEDVTLTIAPGALAEDTEIEISAVPVPEWPEELTGLGEVSVAGDFLRLSPDGLVLAEPAVLTRRVDEIVELAEGEVLVREMAVLSRSDGQWELLEPAITIDDDGATIEAPIEHFSGNVVLFRRHRVVARTALTPGRAQRRVGHHFIARLSVDVQLGALTERFWGAEFSVGSGPLVLGIPSSYLVQNIGSGDSGPPFPSEAEPDQLLAPPGTPHPGTFPAAYNCAATGQARFSARFEFAVRPAEVLDLVEALDVVMGRGGSEPAPVGVSGVVGGVAECVDDSADLAAGVVDVDSDVSSDPAGHACCVRPPPRRARVTLGSLWFTDAKLGDSSDWQGLFFDPVPGSADDVMTAPSDPTVSPPNSLEIALADDFDESGRFTVEGTGTVAGFPGIGVRLEAVASDAGNWSGTLTKGTNGGLPTGQPIVYDISGSLVAPEPIEFVDDLAAAFRAGDSQFLLDHLHPDVLGLYGGACVGFTESLLSPDLEIAVHSIVDVLDWTVTLDANDLVIPNAVRLDVTRTENGEAKRTVMHIAARPGDEPPTEMTWFADCGDPFAVA